MFLEKDFTDYVVSAERIKVFLLAPTGVSAININGTIIHSALNIPTNCRSRNLPKVSDSERCELRNLLSEIQVVIIDEISMVSNITFLCIHQRLCEIFRCNKDKPFVGKIVSVVGDLLQLPPVLLMVHLEKCLVCGVVSNVRINRSYASKAASKNY